MIPRDTTTAMITVSMKIAMFHTLLLAAEHIKPTALWSNSKLMGRTKPRYGKDARRIRSHHLPAPWPSGVGVTRFDD
jgi:hypothetical protein